MTTVINIYAELKQIFRWCHDQVLTENKWGSDPVHHSGLDPVWMTRGGTRDWPDCQYYFHPDQPFTRKPWLLNLFVGKWHISRKYPRCSVLGERMHICVESCSKIHEMHLYSGDSFWISVLNKLLLMNFFWCYDSYTEIRVESCQSCWNADACKSRHK